MSITIPDPIPTQTVSETPTGFEYVNNSDVHHNKVTRREEATKQGYMVYEGVYQDVVLGQEFDASLLESVSGTNFSGAFRIHNGAGIQAASLAVKAPDTGGTTFTVRINGQVISSSFSVPDDGAFHTL